MTGENPPCDVVVLEDDDLVRDVLSDIVAAEGFTVCPVATAEDALERIGSGRCCTLLLTDVDLGPGRSGFEAARAAQERCPSLPVIYLTGRPSFGNGREFRPNERFLRKPFRTMELMDAIRSLGIDPPVA